MSFAADDYAIVERIAQFVLELAGVEALDQRADMHRGMQLGAARRR